MQRLQRRIPSAARIGRGDRSAGTSGYGSHRVDTPRYPGSSRCSAGANTAASAGAHTASGSSKDPASELGPRSRYSSSRTAKTGDPGWWWVGAPGLSAPGHPIAASEPCDTEPRRVGVACDLEAACQQRRRRGWSCGAAGIPGHSKSSSGDSSVCPSSTRRPEARNSPRWRLHRSSRGPIYACGGAARQSIPLPGSGVEGATARSRLDF
jgi:hypothetical protein